MAAEKNVMKNIGYRQAEEQTDRGKPEIAPSSSKRGIKTLSSLYQSRTVTRIILFIPFFPKPTTLGSVNLRIVC